MNLKKMLKDQKELDTLILNNNNITKYPYNNMLLAFRVELSELANEWEGFKHWKNNKNNNRGKLLLEFADCLHFALSLENDIYYNLDNTTIQGQYDTYYKRIIDIISLQEQKDLIDLFNNCYIEYAPLENLLKIGLALNISFEEMEKYYYIKHKINYDRIKENY